MQGNLEESCLFVSVYRVHQRRYRAAITEVPFEQNDRADIGNRCVCVEVCRITQASLFIEEVNRGPDVYFKRLDDGIEATRLVFNDQRHIKESSCAENVGRVLH